VTTSDLLVSAWDVGPMTLGLSAVAVAFYVYRYRTRAGRHAAFFGAAVLVFFLSQASPIGVLAQGYLFSAHMLQHLLLVLVVPPLVYLGLPRESGSPAPGSSSPRLVLTWLSGVSAMWVWHAPTLCNAAASSRSVQAVQTISLVVMGLAFFRPVLAPRPADRMQPLGAVLYLFGACIACSVLGIIVTLSPVQVCSAYVHPNDVLGVMPLLRDSWGLTCKADQEVGGLLMWVPACILYAFMILAALARFYAEDAARPEPIRGAP
jgi:putative membrane protein